MSQILILDWDDVVSNTAAFLAERNTILKEAGAPQELIDQTYKEIKADGHGYNLTTHIRLIFKQLNSDAEPIIEKMKGVIKDMSRFVFEDAREFIELMHSKKVPLGVLTAGDAWFQVHKIATSGLQTKFAMVEVVSGQNFIEEKVKRIKNFLDRFDSAVMFDDRTPILERMATVWAAQLKPIFVNRKKEAVPAGLSAISSFSDQALSKLIS